MAAPTLRSEKGTPAVAVHGTVSAMHTDRVPAPPGASDACEGLEGGSGAEAGQGQTPPVQPAGRGNTSGLCTLPSGREAVTC